MTELLVKPVFCHFFSWKWKRMGYVFMICKMDKHVLIACVQVCFLLQLQYGYTADRQECVCTFWIKVFYTLPATSCVSPGFESFSAVSCYIRLCYKSRCFNAKIANSLLPSLLYPLTYLMCATTYVYFILFDNIY